MELRGHDGLVVQTPQTKPVDSLDLTGCISYRPHSVGAAEGESTVLYSVDRRRSRDTYTIRGPVRPESLALNGRARLAFGFLPFLQRVYCNLFWSLLECVVCRGQGSSMFW